MVPSDVKALTSSHERPRHNGERFRDRIRHRSLAPIKRDRRYRDTALRMETDTLGKKRRGNVCDGDGELARRTRARSNERVVLEDEVKEFFAILHRIREASGSCYRRVDRGGNRTAMTGKEEMGRWWPTFKLQDFEEATPVMSDEVSSGGGALLVENAIAFIDLNVEPETESPTRS